VPELGTSTILSVLQNGEITIKGKFIWGSNYTFLAEVCRDADVIQSVYKPSRGERPLWDFPTASLARREAAAYLVSEALGWELVPPTVYRRKKAPIGPGSLQLFIEHDPDLHYFNLSEVDKQRLRPVVLFDLLINNADRKGSHLLFDNQHHLWLIDHGICFHAEDKLRTVIWDFAGEPIPEKLLDDLERFSAELAFDSALKKTLQELLNQNETKALVRRATHLTTTRQFPQPNPDERSFPWPPL
jgi:Phosphatidylinositol 3- and 4-kinase